MNFLHMTGVKTRLSAQQFYAACLESKLSEYDFEIDGVTISRRASISSLYDRRFY